MSDEGEKRALGALMKALIARRTELTIQQYRTIRGQALAGDVEGAARGLDRALRHRYDRRVMGPITSETREREG